MKLRQTVLVARDLDAVVADLTAVLGIEVAFNDPQVREFGLRNAVMPIGDSFLEVVSPIDPKATAQRYLERRRGDGGYMLILQCDDLDADAGAWPTWECARCGSSTCRTSAARTSIRRTRAARCSRSTTPHPRTPGTGPA